MKGGRDYEYQRKMKTTNEAINDQVHVRILDTGQHQYEDEGGLEGEIPEEHHPIIVLHGGLLSLNTSLIWEI